MKTTDASSLLHQILHRYTNSLRVCNALGVDAVLLDATFRTFLLEYKQLF